MCNLIHADLYWIPSSRRVTARSTVRTSKVVTLPADALFIGTYAHPFYSPDFVEDLEDVLVLLARAHSAGRSLQTRLVPIQD